MALANLELLKLVQESYLRQDYAILEPLLADDVAMDWSRSVGLLRGHHVGREAVRAYVHAFMDAWDESLFEAEDLIADEDGLIAVATHIRLRGSSSGLEVDAHGGFLMRTAGGLIAEMVLFQGPDHVRAALPRYRARTRLAGARLYFVCDGRPNGADPEPLLESAFQGGADVVQLREKAPRCAEEVLSLAEPFHRAAAAHGGLFILNDTPELVAGSGAAGVHVGQDDHAVAEARGSAGPGALVGLSTHTPAELDAACAAAGDERPDYVSVGPVWETPTKPGRPATGLDYVRYAAAHANLPWFAIGGIDADNVDEVAAAGARRVVVVRAIRDASDPAAVTARLRGAMAPAGAVVS